VRADLAEEQLDEVAKVLKEQGVDVLYCSRSVRDVASAEMDKLRKDIEGKPIIDQIGIQLNVTHVLQWILKLFGHKEGETLWKVMVDGRPKSKNSGEVIIAISPVSLSTEIQSSEYVFPLAIISGQENESTFQTFEAIINSALDIKEVNGIAVDWIHVSDLKALWISLGLKKACIDNGRVKPPLQVLPQK